MVFSNNTLTRACTVSFAVAGVIVGTVGQAMAQVINGAGATFPAPLYQRYFAEYKKATGTTVNYNPIGSGAGIRQFIAGTVNFGASDVPPSASEKGQMRNGLLLVPTAGGAVAVVYNLSGVNNLQISRANLAKIFSGEITNWRQVDPKLPNRAIRVVVRADGSGTTEIFTSHLSAISSSFRSKVGANKEPDWGFTVLKGPKNDGVAALVRQTEGAIGYVQDTFARQNAGPTLRTAKIQNKAGRFVEPSLAEANRALEGVKFNPDFTAEASDPANGYPIVGLTWLLVRTNGNGAQAAEVRRLLTWILTTGQGINNQLEFTRIPTTVTQQVIRQVNQIK